MKVQIKQCARCGEDHADLEMRKFAKPIAPPEWKGWSWQYWAPCPVNGDPVIIHVATDGPGGPELPGAEGATFGPPSALG